MTVQRLKAGVHLTATEYHIVDLVKRVGLADAKIVFLEEKSEPTWYRVKRQLKAKDVFLESIINEDFRGEIQSVDNVADFQLVPAEYAA